MAKYQWKMPNLYDVDAETAASEINRIKGGRDGIEARELVDASREESAPLHSCFEWDDGTAAEMYREQQAQHIIRNIVVVREKMDTTPVRAFVHVQKSYQPIEVVMKDVDKTDELLKQAYRDMLSFRRKYSALKQLAPIMSAIDSVLSE